MIAEAEARAGGSNALRRVASAYHSRYGRDYAAPLAELVASLQMSVTSARYIELRIKQSLLRDAVAARASFDAQIAQTIRVMGCSFEVALWALAGREIEKRQGVARKPTPQISSSHCVTCGQLKGSKHCECGR